VALQKEVDRELAQEKFQSPEKTFSVTDIPESFVPRHYADQCPDI
jgi:hypothetical protein